MREGDRDRLAGRGAHALRYNSGETRRLVLASSSPRRRELLSRVGLEVVVFEPKVEERYESPFEPERAVEVALRKAGAARRALGEALPILGADTVVVLDGAPLGKPRDEEEARRMLRALRGRWHEVVTGLALLVPGKGALTDLVVTKVKMRNFGDDEVEAYVRTGEPLDKAGAYGIQGLGGLLVEKIRGCYYNVVGLPLSRLAEMLRAAGLSPWPARRRLRKETTGED